jgi:hypothetical protein
VSPAVRRQGRGGPLAGVGEAGKGSGTRCRSREGEKLAVVAGGSGGADPIASGREADKGQPSAQATEGNGGDGRRGLNVYDSCYHFLCFP